MRKCNGILSVLLLVIFLLHGIMGSFMLLNVSSAAGKVLALAGCVILAAHAGLGLILTARSVGTLKKTGGLYLGRNRMFLLRRASGFLLLFLLFFHIGLFGSMQDGGYILYPFTPGRLAVQLLFTAALFLHILSNLRPLLLTLGIAGRQKKADLELIFSVLGLFTAGAVIYYFAGWQSL